MKNSVDSIKGYKVLKVIYGNYKEEILLYIKKHSIKESDPKLAPDKTLFVLNIPPFMNKSCINHVFEHFGTISHTISCSKPSSHPSEVHEDMFSNPLTKGFSVAYVVFEKADSIHAVLDNNVAIKLKTQECSETGIKKWFKLWNDCHISEAQLLKSCEEYMEQFDNVTNEATGAEEPDEDGWVTVTKGGRRPGLTRSENVEEKIKESVKVKESKKELLNFYTFQIREKKMQHIEELRRKFEEDKAKLALIKQRRKFKPF